MAMRPRDQRQMFVTALLALVICGAFVLLLAGIDVTTVKELLAIVFPPLVALTAAGIGRENEKRRS
jgi:hypothetical protein